MALSLLSQQQQHQQPSFLDLQTFFDLPSPIHHQQQQQQLEHQHYQIQQNRPITRIDVSTYNIGDIHDQMEYNSPNHHQQQHQYQQEQQSNNNNTNNNSSSNNNNTNGNTSNNSIRGNNNSSSSNNNNNRNNNNNNITSGNSNQNLIKTHNTYMSGYHHHHIGTDYEQVINFVDSPPNSEESWTDEHSKGSPGPQIIDVQTIYSNSGSRKRRMDWDSLDIGQSGNNTTNAQAGEVQNKIAHLDKDKQKKEKLAGRGSWTDDIGFDLNAEFNSNSYLNNESFLSFSPALTVLKQEPQTDQLKVNNNNNTSNSNNIVNNNNNPNKNPLSTDSGCVSKNGEKSTAITEASTVAGASHINNNNQQGRIIKNDLNTTLCGCGSPKSAQQQDFETTGGNIEKASNTSATGIGNNAGNVYNVDKSRSTGGIIQQQLVDSSKIENSPPAATATSYSDDHKFQYILAAATSIATKNNEETLTYLNQGQSYEIKLKKIGDLSFYRDKILRSVIKICFHERRLQFMEREQMQQWQASRPGERIIEVDVPLSYGLCHVSQPLNANYLSTVEVFWDPMKEVGVYIKVNCISTEFTPKKHGGEKGVPFRLQIETYIENTNSNATGIEAGAASRAAATTATAQHQQQQQSSTVIAAGASPSPGTPGNLTPNNNSNGGNGNNTAKQPVHAAACQIKVFKLKGADRKHKQDREKIQKRPQSEQDKFQPSYECTIMNDISLDVITPSVGCFSPEYMKIWPNSPVHIPKYDGILPFANASPAANSSPIAINSVTSTNSPTLKLMDANMVSPQQVITDMDDYTITIVPESSPSQVAQWLTNHRLTAYLSTFAHFLGSDIMRMSKEDLIQICGLADGIRMFNILRAKAITPRLTIYVSLDGSSYNAIYLVSNTSKELTQKIFKLPGFYEMVANGGNTPGAGNGLLETGTLYNSWVGGMHTKYSGSGSNIFNDVNKTFIYVAGPAGVHVTITDEVLNNEIKDGSLYALDVQNGKIVMKLISKNDN